jgi:hypothetical protein
MHHYRLTTQKQVRAEFWREHKGVKGITPRRITNYSGNGKMHNTDTRCAFADFVDYLSKDGAISEELASKVTL